MTVFMSFTAGCKRQHPGGWKLVGTVLPIVSDAADNVFDNGTYVWCRYVTLALLYTVWVVVNGLLKMCML